MRGRRGETRAVPRADTDDPVLQLEQWRSTRYDDTTELPALDVGSWEPLPEPEHRDRPRHSVGLFVGGGLVAIALVLSGLAAVGVGPVHDLLASTNGSGGSSTPTPTPTPTAGSAGTTGSAGSAGSAGSSGQASGDSSSASGSSDQAGPVGRRSPVGRWSPVEQLSREELPVAGRRRVLARPGVAEPSPPAGPRGRAGTAPTPPAGDPAAGLPATPSDVASPPVAAGG